jgi:hypothetical protein
MIEEKIGEELNTLYLCNPLQKSGSSSKNESVISQNFSS